MENKCRQDVVDSTMMSLHSLATCAVSVFSLIATLTVACIGFGIEKQKLIYILIAIIVCISALFFYRVFLIWATYYVVEFVLNVPSDNTSYIGTKCIICMIYNVRRWSEFSSAIKEIVKQGGGSLAPSKYIIQKLSNKQLSKTLYVGIFPNHIGVLLFIWLALFLIICFAIFCYIGSGWKVI